ncbi:nitroreductase [Paenibacillus thiaminolyticus]|uniref:nitroreductase family protein n=1 Tax=Paenibacillus thiaminolyticus TaxID=49283 RepID=UPI0035A65D0C
MSIANTIRERRSIHRFSDRPVDKELVLSLLNDAVWAPNHGLREPWRFIYAAGGAKDRLVRCVIELVEGTKMRGWDEEQKTKFIQTNLAVPAYLIVVMPEDPRPHIWEEDLAAVSALIQNFQLLAWEQGLGMLWHTGDYIYNRKFREISGVQPGEKIVGVLRMGHFDEIPPARPRTNASERFTELS